MSIHTKISRSLMIPSYIDVTSTLKERQIKAKFKKEKEFQEQLKKGKLKFIEAQKKLNLIDHGFGVLEDSNTGVIWYKEGDYIMKQEDIHRENILKAMLNN